jgi:hypothetical protein
MLNERNIKCCMKSRKKTLNSSFINNVEVKKYPMLRAITYFQDLQLIIDVSSINI